MLTNQQRCQKRCSAFTLLELLVTIAIIALLAILTTVGVAKAKARSRSTVCQSNLKQIGTWLNQFVLDHSAYPLAIHSLTNRYPEHAPVWIRSLRKTGGTHETLASSSGDLFDCPAAIPPGDRPESEGYSDYGYNAEGIRGFEPLPFLGLGGKGGENGELYPPPVSESSVVAPSEMIAIGDSFVGSSNGLADGSYWSIGIWAGNKPRAGETERALRRHSKQGNFVFCDGHVQSLSLPPLLISPTAESAALWNRDHQPHLERLQKE